MNGTGRGWMAAPWVLPVAGPRRLLSEARSRTV